MELNINKRKLNPWFIDQYIDPRIFENKILMNLKNFENNTEVIKIDSSYNFRPDKLCYELYGQEQWYPVILALNNMGSFLQFKPDELGNRIKVPTRDSLIQLLDTIGPLGFTPMEN